MNRICRPLFGLLTIWAAAGSSAWAQEDTGRRLGVFSDWTAFVAGTGGARQCVAFSLPEEAMPVNLNRGDIAILVSHQLAEGEFNVVQVKLGYPINSDSEVKIDIDGRSWTLFPNNENAWAYDQTDNAAILRAMKAGAMLYVEGLSARGNTTTDRYSLSGISAAVAAIDAACGR